MGIAAYNRGSKLIRSLIDRELKEKSELLLRDLTRIYCHKYIDWRSGEDVSIWYDEIGPLVNQNRDCAGNIKC